MLFWLSETGKIWGFQAFWSCSVDFPHYGDPLADIGHMWGFWRTCGSKCRGEGGGIFPTLCVECCLVVLCFVVVISVHLIYLPYISFKVGSLALGQLLPQCHSSNPEGYGEKKPVLYHNQGWHIQHFVHAQLLEWCIFSIYSVPKKADELNISLSLSLNLLV